MESLNGSTPTVRSEMVLTLNTSIAIKENGPLLNDRQRFA